MDKTTLLVGLIVIVLAAAVYFIFSGSGSTGAATVSNLPSMVGGC